MTPFGKTGALLIRLVKDERGAHTLEMALAVGLFALVAGFGFFFIGDAIADFLVDISTPFQNAFGPSGGG